MEAKGLPVTRGTFVRLTTDRLTSEGVARGGEGLTLHRKDDGSWFASFEGGHYVSVRESEFEVIGPALQPRGVVVPSLNGGWLSFQPYPPGRRESVPLPEQWGREPGVDDFVGLLSFCVPGTSTGFPVLWDRERQLSLVYFFDMPDRMTWTFPRDLSLDWPDPELEIRARVTVDPDRGATAAKAAELDVTTRNPIGDRRTVTGHLIVPAYTCDALSRWLVDLFPAVTADDLDWV